MATRVYLNPPKVGKIMAQHHIKGHYSAYFWGPGRLESLRDSIQAEAFRPVGFGFSSWPQTLWPKPTGPPNRRPKPVNSRAQDLTLRGPKDPIIRYLGLG